MRFTEDMIPNLSQQVAVGGAESSAPTLTAIAISDDAVIIIVVVAIVLA
ncbi:hypothetical protein ACFOPN_09510 [Xanthomonas hyacinthi]|nr:hypothetical protein [Xanthomonas hyacinthi]